MSTPNVSFSVNVCNSDMHFLEQTLRHMVRALNFPFTEKLIAYDPGTQEGKYSSRLQGNRNEIELILQRLINDQVIDRVDIIPWSSDEQHRIIKKYFSSNHIDLKDFSGAPIYQYLYALDRCTSPYVFHADSDMLFHRANPGNWINDGVALLQQEPKVIVTRPRGGPPQAQTWLEKLTGRSFEPTPARPWKRVEFTSTRYFLMDMRKFDACLPLIQKKTGEPLENSLTHTFNMRGYEHWMLTTLDHWTIHPWSHDENYIRYLPDLIWAIENNIYPFRRDGYRWDLRTDGKSINQWLRVLRRHRRAKN